MSESKWSYRFKFGEFQATVVSDGHFGSLPVGPIFASNAPERELEAVLMANFVQPMVQGTCNALVVDTGHERILVDTGFGEKFGPAFGNSPGLETNCVVLELSQTVSIWLWSPTDISTISAALLPHRALPPFPRPPTSSWIKSGTIGRVSTLNPR
jgi:hypothetical protein